MSVPLLSSSLPPLPLSPSSSTSFRSWFNTEQEMLTKRLKCPPSYILDPPSFPEYSSDPDSGVNEY